MCEGDNMLDPAMREEIRQTVHAAMTDFMATMMGQAMAMRAGMGMPQMPAGVPKPPMPAPMQPPMGAPMQPPAAGPMQGAPAKVPVQDAGERSTSQLVGSNNKPTHGDVSLDYVIPNVLPLERPRKISSRQFYFLNSTEPEPNTGDRTNFVAPGAPGVNQPTQKHSG